MIVSFLCSIKYVSSKIFDREVSFSISCKMVSLICTKTMRLIILLRLLLIHILIWSWYKWFRVCIVANLLKFPENGGEEITKKWNGGKGFIEL
jgi:hypothetical protein